MASTPTRASWLLVALVAALLASCATAQALAAAPEGAWSWLGAVFVAVVEDVTSILTGGLGGLSDVLAFLFGP